MVLSDSLNAKTTPNISVELLVDLHQGMYSPYSQGPDMEKCRPGASRKVPPPHHHYHHLPHLMVTTVAVAVVPLKTMEK